MTPRRLYRTLAAAEAVTWTFLIIAMVLEYVTRTTDALIRPAGGLHGLVFLAYCATTVLVGVDGRWPLGRILLGLASAIPPWMTIPFERWADRRGHLADRWRLAEESPASLGERLAAVAVRRPVPAAVGVLVLVGAVFVGLLQLGPPTEWGR
jgi:integral membrane protein